MLHRPASSTTNAVEQQLADVVCVCGNYKKRAFLIPTFCTVPLLAHARPLVSIENVVASTGLGQEVDLDEAVARLPEVKYQPRKFPGLVLKLPSHHVTVLIFRSGKIICTGAKSEGGAIDGIRAAMRLLWRAGAGARVNAIVDIQNIVASADLRRRIRLESAARVLPRSMYEPEQFPGIIHRMVEPKTVLLLFASGRVVCAGARKEIDVHQSVHNLYNVLEDRSLFSHAAAEGNLREPKRPTQ